MGYYLYLFIIIFSLTTCSNRTNKSTAISESEEKIELGISFGDYYQGEDFMPYIRELGAKLSLIKIFWEDCEPAPPSDGVHTYDWTIVDKFLNQLQEDDIVLINIFTNADWVTVEGPSEKGRPLKNDAECLKYGLTCSQAYKDFISNLVKRVNNKVKYWQRDTEPAAGGLEEHFPADKPREYVDLQKYFHEMVKREMPSAVIAGVSHNGTFYNGEPVEKSFFEYIIKETRDYFDVMDVRFYSNKYTIDKRVKWFRDEMQKNSYLKPIISAEHGGPTPFEFPDEFNQFKEWCYDHGYTDEEDPDQVIGCKNDMKKDGILPIQIEMFFQDIDQELSDKVERIHCRDITQRVLLLLENDVKKQWKWNLRAVKTPYGYGVPTFSALRLMNFDTLEKRPSFYCYQRMTGKMNGAKYVRRLDTGNEDLFLYEIVKQDNLSKFYVIWERRDLFYGEDQPPITFEFQTGFNSATVTDVFGKAETKSTVNGILSLNITDTPLFIE